MHNFSPPFRAHYRTSRHRYGRQRGGGERSVDRRCRHTCYTWNMKGRRGRFFSFVARLQVLVAPSCALVGLWGRCRASEKEVFTREAAARNKKLLARARKQYIALFLHLDLICM